MAQLVASVSGVVLCGVAEIVGSNLRGKIFTASIGLIHYIPPYLSTVSESASVSDPV